MANQENPVPQHCLPVRAHRTAAGPDPVASDNAPASQGGPEEYQQTAHREPLKLHQEADEDDTRTDGLSAHLQDQPSGPAVHPRRAGLKRSDPRSRVETNENHMPLCTCAEQHVN